MNVVAKLCLSLVLLSSFAYATGPTIGGPSVGLWYNPSEPGRGYVIDIQGDTMVVTTYVYLASGDPIWYLSSGIYNHATGVFQSTYDSFSDGQCFGCPWVSPVVHSASGGPITITFYNDQSATLTYPGGSTNIVRFNYGFATLLDVTYGEWAFSYDISGLNGGDWVIFDGQFVGTDGKTYASGHVDLAPNNLALATYDSTVGYSVLVGVGAFEDFYELALDDHRGVGVAWVIPNGGNLTGSGSPAAAGRILYQGETTGAATEPKSARMQDRSQFVDAQDDAPADASALARITALRHAMQELKASH